MEICKYDCPPTRCKTNIWNCPKCPAWTKPDEKRKIEMSIEDVSDNELIAEINRRGLKVHIDSVEVSIFLNDIEVGGVTAR